MITFERSFDFELIRRIITHPRIWDKISDDNSPRREDYQPIQHEAIWYVVARDVYPEGHDLLGLWMFHPLNSICWEVHTALMPVAWGEPGLEAARLLPAWIWEHTPCRRIVSNVPSTNRLALHFAIKAGMTIFGCNRGSYLKDGKLCDQVCLGISPPEEEAIRRAELAGGLDVAAHAPASPGERAVGPERARRSPISCGVQLREV
jgi:RimJ/RimL family protein N-acetyltransferase